ncbi:putative SOS response-associated peptidase YedK [Paraburkholderia fungorum]|nr:putative SOS response-associated peptidase YedK [Paraburkholderia fungorum]
MCVNYVPTRRSRYAEHFQTELPFGEWPDETYRDYPAPIIRRGADGGRESLVGTFGMKPRKRIPPHVRDFDTMNARSETVGSKPNFAKFWSACQFCLVPAESVFEPRYPPLPDLDVPNRDELIKAVLKQKSERWAISLADGAPLAVAGLWRAWDEPEGGISHSFTMLTVNADQHPLLRQFHKHLKPDGTPNEKRGVVILRPDQYDDWLACRDPEVARTFLSLLPPESLAVAPAPKAPRRRSVDAETPVEHGEDSLF